MCVCVYIYIQVAADGACVQIEGGAYGEALSLAARFGLDSDLVYQQQWRRTPVSSDAIHNYLVRILHHYTPRLPLDVPFIMFI